LTFEGSDEDDVSGGKKIQKTAKNAKKYVL
jgi:hypothetical protein